MPAWKSFSPPKNELAEILAPSRTALLVVDVQNDFGHKDGLMGKAGVDLSAVDPAVDAIAHMVDAAHRAGVAVVLISLETSQQLDSKPATLRRTRLGQDSSESRRVCRIGTWGAELYRLIPAPADMRVSKARYSSFQNTPLDLQLRSRGIDTILVCGLTTECCVETAVRDGFHLDYNVFVVGDASATYDAALQDAALRTMGLYCALIVDSGTVAEAWSA
jgi:ureidoacrylate peracid hydrolase